MVSNKHVFWQALLAAILIFGVGILFGVAFEDSRNRDVEITLLRSEVNFVDSQIMGGVIGNFDINCEESTGSLIRFADKIYEEAKLLEDYDASSQLTGTLEVLHRRYDLLRVVLWNQAIDLREKCGADFHTMVYVFQYKDPDIGTRSNQGVFSKVLQDLKGKYGKDILLIPIAGDLDLESVQLIKDSYGIESYPVVILNEKEVIDDLTSLNNIESLLIESVSE